MKTHATILTVALLSAARLVGCAATRNSTVQDQLQINNESQTVGTATDDATITTNVRAALASHPGINTTQIEIQTSDGVVRLAGFVDTNAQRDDAASVASSVPGVRAVDNDLRLNGS